MKKFKTSEDLNRLSVILPLNRARNILTLALRGAEGALRVLFKAEGHYVELTVSQKRALEAYVENYKFLRDAVVTIIADNVSLEDQAAIKVYEDICAEALRKELAKSYGERINEAHACEDSDCDSCENIRRSFSQQDIKDEFDLSDLPEGSVIVPGSEGEN